MNKNKWSFAEVDPADDSYEQKEHGGMIFLLIFGLILCISGLFLVWKIGAFNTVGFFGKEAISSSHSYQKDVLFLLNLPWVAGVWMMQAAIKYFYRKRKKETGRKTK